MRTVLKCVAVIALIAVVFTIIGALLGIRPTFGEGLFLIAQILVSLAALDWIIGEGG